jgi:hypothetical protein
MSVGAGICGARAQGLIRAIGRGQWLQRLLVRTPYARIEDMKNEHDREPTPDETAGIVWWNSLA